MARTSSLNCLSCRNPYQTPLSLNPSPLFTEKPFSSLKSASSDPVPKNRLRSMTSETNRGLRPQIIARRRCTQVAHLAESKVCVNSLPNRPEETSGCRDSKIVARQFLSLNAQGRETHPEKASTPIKRVCVNNFKGCSCSFFLFSRNSTRGTQKEFRQTVCTNCFQLGLLGWVFFWGGFLSLEIH